MEKHILHLSKKKKSMINVRFWCHNEEELRFLSCVAAYTDIEK